jgi:hypothetical protein
MAQATDVVIPNASQLILIDMFRRANIHKCNFVAKYFRIPPCFDVEPSSLPTFVPILAL